MERGVGDGGREGGNERDGGLKDEEKRTRWAGARTTCFGVKGG